MKNRLVVACLAVLVLGAVLTDVCFGEEKKVEKITVTGVVCVMKDDNDKITDVWVTDDNDEYYDIVLDEKGKKLGKEMEGKRAEVKGTIERKDDTNWVTVQEYKEAPKKKEDEEE